MNLIKILLFIQIYALIIYPTWYAPESNTFVRFVFFNIFYLSILLNSYLAVKILKTNTVKHINKNIFSNLNKPFIIIIIVYIVGLLPFINFPILTGLDDHLHAGFPASMANKFFNIANLITGSNILSILLFWVGFILSILLAKKIISTGSIHPTKLIVLIYPILLIYFFIIIKINLEQFGQISIFHRYPPLGKTFFLIFYLLFGISNWSSKLSQIVFVLAIAYYIYNYIKFEENNKIINLLIIAFFIFCPLIWNVYLYNHIEHGTIFFSFLIILFFSIWYEKKDNVSLVSLWIFFSAGLVYKRTILFLFPTLFIFLFLLKPKSIIKNSLLFLKAISIPLIFVIPYFIYDKIFSFSPSNIQGFRGILEIFLPILLFPSSNGIFISILWVSGFFYCFKYIKKYLFLLLYAFTIVFLFLMSLTHAWCYIRLLFPIILPFSFFSAIFFFDIYKKFPKIMICFGILMSFEVLYLNFISSNVELITFNTQKYYNVPYEDLVQYIKTHNLYEEKIYAPAFCEPSHFYFYKHNVPLYNYERKIWQSYDQSMDNLLEYLKDNNFNYFVVYEFTSPRYMRYDYMFYDYVKNKYYIPYQAYRTANIWIPWTSNSVPFVKTKIHYELNHNYENYGFELVKKFNTNRLGLKLFKIN